MALLSIACPWDSVDRVHRLIREYEGELTDSDYASDPERAKLTVRLLADKAEELARRVTDATNGRGTAAPQGQ